MVTSQLPERVACYRHADHLTDVHCTRCGRPICPDCMVAVPAGHLCPPCAIEETGTETGRGHARWSPWEAASRARLGRITPVVAALMAVNFAVFAVTTSHQAWEFDYAQVPQLVAQGQVYRLLTATFVHESLAHVLFNMLALFVMGPPVEAALGRNRFLVLYLLAALGGSVCSFAFGPVLVVSVGASGAILGVIGAWFSLARAQRSDTAAIVLLIAFLLTYSFYDTSIDWRAHVGGLATGVAVGAAYAWSARRPARPSDRRWVSARGAVAAPAGGVRLVYDGAFVVALVALFAILVALRSAQL